MRPYVGQARGADLISALTAAGIGECTQRGELPPRRSPWFHDNGAFRDWTNHKAFNAVRWERDQWRIRDRKLRPDFVVVPDLVGGGADSLRTSSMFRSWVAEDESAYLVVQEGMSTDDVDAAVRQDGYHGLFVGGASIEWKTSSARSWLDLARRRGIRIHVGRVGIPERVRWARELGVDSIDSSFPLWNRQRLTAFMEACNG